jgi:Leucine-rich repeat (LRR) protein
VDAERQAAAVERQLKQVNPRWNGMLEYTIDGDDVSRVRLTGPALRDFWPIVALGRLKELDCSGSGLDSLTHVGQLRRLESLDCSRTSVRDLRPIAHLRFLSQFDCSETGVYDLSPLKLVPLRELRCFFVTAYNEKAIDALAVMGTLETVNGLTLDQLSARRTEVEELARSQPAYSPEEQLARVVELLKKFNPDYDGVVAKHEIQGGRLVLINLVGARISDLSPLRALADLRAVNCGATQVADLSPLAGLPLLHLTCGATPVADLSPLKGMSLTAIQCGGTRVADLSPLKGMPLTSVNCISTPVSDLSPLAGMPLTNLGCHDTLISDLAPLKGMPLTVFSCGMTQVSDLSPLAGMPLTSLGCGWSRVSDLSPLAGMPLEWLECREEILRKHAPLLREMATLKTINERPAEEFWRELDQGQGSGDNREVPDR